MYYAWFSGHCPQIKTNIQFVVYFQEAFSPQLLDLCLQRPIVLVRNLAPACNIDLSLYTTKTLVETHPNHPVEIRNQIEQVILWQLKIEEGI
jgi:hypothetical protein